MAPRRRRLKTKAQTRKKSKDPLQSRNWLELPHDVISTILLKLGAVEILESAQKVCTLWRKICKDPLMWRCIDMRNLGDSHDMPYDLQKMAMHAVDRSCGQLLEINVEFFGTDEILEYIADRSPRLRCLKFRCCYGSLTNEGFANETKKLSLLEELELTLCDVSKEDVEAVGRNCPLLKSLKLNQQSIRGYSDPCDEIALAIADNLHGLRSLQLIGNDLTNVGLKAILDGCPHLESLDLRRCFSIDLKANIGKTCAERIKNLRCPDDPTNDCEFSFDGYFGDYGYESYMDSDFDYDDFTRAYNEDLDYDDFTRAYNDDSEDDIYSFLGPEAFMFDNENFFDILSLV